MESNATGRPGYDPADLLKLYIYGYLNRIRSSRRLEAETHRSLGVTWLLRRLRPDFKTTGRRSATRSSSAGRPELLRQRRERVRHPFGSINQWMGQGALLIRRIENLRAEVSLTALVHKIRLAKNLAGVPAPISAVRCRSRRSPVSKSAGIASEKQSGKPPGREPSRCNTSAQHLRRCRPAREAALLRVLTRSEKRPRHHLPRLQEPAAGHPARKVEAHPVPEDLSNAAI